MMTDKKSSLCIFRILYDKTLTKRQYSVIGICVSMYIPLNDNTGASYFRYERLL